MLAPTNVPLRQRQSHVWARDPGDFYVEPEWCSQRLFDVHSFVGEVIDPACGCGRVVEAARRAHHASEGWDAVDRGFPGTKVRDFLSTDTVVCNFVSNPPFGIAEAFVEHALLHALHQVVMLLPMTWLCGERRSRWLETTPLVGVLVLTPRPSMPPGAAVAAAGGGTRDFAWFIWSRNYMGRPRVGWLHRDKMEE